MNISEHIILEDKDILVCYKPAGIAVQTPRIGETDMVALLKNYRVSKGEEPYIGLVHRLDQPVEGVMVFAKTKEAAGVMSKQMQSKGFEKCYYAVVCGRMPQPQGTLTDYLLRDGRSNTSKVVPEKTPGAKQAVLHYEVIKESVNGHIQSENCGAHAEAYDGILTLVRVRLETGRHHQIRVQLAHAGCPLVGDRKYNTGNGSRVGNVALCSYRIAFSHPTDGRTVTYEVDPRGSNFVAFLETFGDM